jgi:SAM-dependent methyltransferase
MTDFIQDETYSKKFGAYKKILRLLNHDPGIFNLPLHAKIVDIGCGYGDLLKLLAERGYSQLIGVEPDPICREKNVSINISPGNLYNTGLACAQMDVVIINQVFHHVDDYKKALDEISRILAPNGVLCFMEPLNSFSRLLMDFLTFKTPLYLLPPISLRYAVMKLEVDTGLYPKFLNSQAEFHSLLNLRFNKVFLKKGIFFQFGKYVLK